jgi:type IV secretory pathway VirJ component
MDHLSRSFPNHLKLKIFLAFAILSGIATLGVWLAHLQPPVLKKTIHSTQLGDIPLYQPLWGADGLTLLFADTRQQSADSLSAKLRPTTTAVAVIDAPAFLHTLASADGQCLSETKLSTALSELTTGVSGQNIIIAGIADGAVIPLLHAQTASLAAASNVSIGFSVKSPAVQCLCQPKAGTDTPILTSPWHVVWADQPDAETGVFVRKLTQVTTRIAAYDTPATTLLADELRALSGDPAPQTAAAMPVIESNTRKPSDTLTIFYSGDGGWRDLDRSVAAIMVSQQYPVVGVDVLRYFWEQKSPEQAANDLAASMAYYRSNWGTKSFVLAGYSFGADILPSIYNRLSKTDQDSVKLLALLALGEKADFEIHVSGWLGKNSTGQPLAPELATVPKPKILCVYGQEERTETVCSTLSANEADILELPGGHHFDQNYPALTQKILAVYARHGINPAD